MEKASSAVDLFNVGDPLIGLFYCNVSMFLSGAHALGQACKGAYCLIIGGNLGDSLDGHIGRPAFLYML